MSRFFIHKNVIRIFRLAILCFIFCENTASAQPSDSPVIDSLEQQLKKETQDTSRIKQLCTLSFEYSSRDTKKGIDCAEKALALSKKINWRKGSALSLQFLGRNYWRAGNFKSALQYHQQSLDLWVKIGESKYIATLYLYIGQDYADTHDYLKAIEYLGQSLEMYKSIGAQDKIATVHGIIAWIYDNMGMTAEFKKNELEALRISEELNDVKSVAIYTSNLASDLIYQKKYKEAIDVFERCNAILKKAEDYINLALGYIEMSRCYRESGDEAQAIKLLDSALFYSKKINNNGLIGDVHVNYAGIYSLKKDYAQAGKSLLVAIENYKIANNFKDLLDAYNLGAANYMLTKQFREADDFLKKEKVLLDLYGSTATRTWYYHELYVLDSTTGKSIDAMIHSYRYKAGCDSLIMQENKRKSAQSKLQQEFKKNESMAHLGEMAKHKQTSQEIRDADRSRKYQWTINCLVPILVILFSIFGYRFYKRKLAATDNKTND